MPDPITRDLWMISLAANCAALAIRRTPHSWVVWAGYYFATASALAVFDHYRIPGLYAPIWIAQQVGTVLLLSIVVSSVIRPTIYLIAASSSAAVILGVSIHSVYRWPGSAIEPVMFVCGLIALAAGLVSAIGSIERPSVFTWALSAFLLMYALMMLAGGEYLTATGIGRAWSVMEIAAFAGWSASFLRGR